MWRLLLALHLPAGGDLGYAILDLRSGQLKVNSPRAYPMQHVAMLPLAIVALKKVDRGEFKLDQTFTIQEQDLSMPNSDIARVFKRKPLTYTLKDLIKLCIEHSDHTAFDVLFQACGGPAKVNAELANLKLNGIRVDRTEKESQVAYMGLKAFRPHYWTEWGANADADHIPRAMRLAKLYDWMNDPRDTATPLGIVRLLARLYRGELLKPQTTYFLERSMAMAQTGPHRIREILPPGTLFMHKTGTGKDIFGLCGAQNDCGIFQLKDGHAYAIAMFMKGFYGSEKSRDQQLREATQKAFAELGIKL